MGDIRGMDTEKTVWAEKVTVIEDLMTVQDVARIIRCQDCTVRKYVLKDTIPFIKVGGSLRFRPSEIAAWIDGTWSGSTALKVSGTGAEGACRCQTPRLGTGRGQSPRLVPGL
jgi:excisionase family DNA binding protein